MSEADKKTLLVPMRPALDKDLWPIFDRIDQSIPPIYDQLLPPQEVIETAKETFFASGRTENPDLRPLGVDLEDLTRQEIDWVDFKYRLAETEMAEPVKQAYLWRTNEEIAKCRMVHYSVMGDMRRFRRYNEFIYNRPDPEIYKATTDWFRHQASELTDHEVPEVREAAEQVLGLVPDLDGNRTDLMPSPEVFELIKEQHFKEGGYFALVLAGVNLPEGTKVPLEVGDPALIRVLNNIQSGYSLADARGSAWSADHINRVLSRPATYNMPYTRFLGLPVGHEVRHIVERQNGLRQPIRLLGGGLDRYESGNEGRAVIGEQVPYKSFEQFAKQLRWQDIMRRHFAISLAAGAVGEPRSFSETFRIVNAVDRLWQRSKKPEDIGIADERADKRTWDLMATKVFKGTDGSGGAAYLKDKLYLEGNVRCWKVAETNPELIGLGDRGKFDITEPRHIAINQALGVLPTL